jgi:diguanylate cyclase (GGDEF)-like protein
MQLPTITYVMPKGYKLGKPGRLFRDCAQTVRFSGQDRRRSPKGPMAPPTARRPAPSLQRRLLLFAVAVLAPVLAGALASGLLLLSSAARSQEIAEEVVEESSLSQSLFQSLEAARLAGSGYMEEGEQDDLAAFETAGRSVDRALATDVFDEGDEHERIRALGRDWQAAVRQLRETPTGVGSSSDDAEDPEDVFEEHMNAALTGAEGLVAGSTTEISDDLVAARRSNRNQAAIALAALLVALALAAYLARRLTRGMLRPIHHLTRAARAFGSGHLGHRVTVGSSAELEEVADAFNRMADALQQQHGQLEHQAFTDALTEIPNRALFEERARHALERTAGTGQRLAVLMIDLDDFKLVNDGLGHSSGDELIALAATRLSGAARPTDTVARLGGDEFAVLLEGVRGLDDALAAAERFRRLFDTPFHLGGSDVVVSASIGIALSVDSLNADELLHRADLAMYRVKDRGKDGTAFFDPAMEQRAVKRLDALNALRRAVEGDELVAHYQPIVDLETGRVVAAEALLRWERPGHGLVPPLEFIPLAEETGLITQVGEWVLRAACRQACEWRREGLPEIRVGVNVSARQLLDADFEQMVADVLAETGLEPGALVLEVTESSVMMNADVTIPKLDRIVAGGVRLTLDDFGEGHSSLSHIRRLPIEGLKIARPFVKELADPAGDARLVRGIVELAHSLELRLVAEGIEDAEQREALRALGCPLGQGFLFARPLEPSAFRALLRAQPVG